MIMVFNSIFKNIPAISCNKIYMINIYYLIKDKSYLRLDRISASNYPRDNFIRYRDRPEYGWNGHHWTSINDSITQSLFDITDVVYVYHNFAISKKKIKNFWLFFVL